MLILLFLILLSFCGKTQQQKKINIDFAALFQQQNITFNKPLYTLADGNVFSFSMLKFYISNIKIMDTISNTILFYAKEPYLINIEDSASCSLQFSIPTASKYQQISFMLGLDTAYQISNKREGVLNPMNGMYWSWHSGYVNIKLDGTCSKCHTRNNEFSHHLGGYQTPYVSQFYTSLFMQKDSAIIYLNLDEYLSQINFSSEANEMTPSEHAVQLSKKIASSFYIK